MISHTFYKASSPFFEKAIAQLVLKIYNSGEKLLINFSDELLMDKLNDYLWTFNQKDFIPHGSIKDPLPEQQPVLLCIDEENSIEAKIIININRADSNLNSFERTLYICNSDDGMASKIEARIAKLNELKLNNEIWIQDDYGKWSK